MGLPIWGKGKVQRLRKRSSATKRPNRQFRSWQPRIELLENRLLPSLAPFLVADINPGNNSSSPQSTVNVNGTLFFSADDGVHGNELWRSDGTAKGTMMVKDIWPGSLSSIPPQTLNGGFREDFVNVNGIVFFKAFDGRASGFELWRSDGTAAGTVAVFSGFVSSGDPTYLTNANGTLFFGAHDGIHGDELWRSDGTAAGTTMVADINPGSGGSYLGVNAGMINSNGRVFFRASDGMNTRLWESDGTAAGTFPLPQSRPSALALTDVNGTLFFSDSNALWKTNGTVAGTVMVKDNLFVGAGETTISLNWLANVNGTFFFGAADQTHGEELWRSDGTAGGTTMVLDLRPGAQGSFPEWLTNVNNSLFFFADDGVHGRELWQSDGTAAGTTLIADVNPGSNSSFPPPFLRNGGPDSGISPPVAPLANINGTLFFDANDGTHGFELWQSNGKASGTGLIADINPGSGNSSPYFSSPYFTNLNGTLFFSATDANHGVELWGLHQVVPADTTTAITASDNAPVFGETVTYTATVMAVSPGTGAPASGTVTFRFDGGPGMSTNIVSGQATIPLRWPATGPGHTVDAMFNGDDTAGAFGASTAPQLMVTINPDTTTTTLSQAVTNLPRPDGTHTYLHQAATFTAMVRSANGATVTGSVTFFDGLATLQAGVTFSSAGNGLATAILTTAGLSAGGHTITAVYSDNSGDNAFSNSSSLSLIHTVDFHPLPLPEIPGVIPTPTGSFQAPFVDVNGTTFFTANDGTSGQELWETAFFGTLLVRDINPGPGSSYPTNLTNVNGTLFFSATDGTHGFELWESDGLAAGTSMVLDINPGLAGSTPSNLTNVNGTLFFAANDGTHGSELWRSNGTALGTTLVKDIDPGRNGSAPTQLTNVNGTLFFVANDGAHGVELFESNGVGQGTFMVKDIRPGSAGSYPTNLTNVNGTLFFSATNGVSGQELWKSNATRPGTVLVKDINAGSTGSYPTQLTNVNGTVFFVANDGRHGAELFESNGTGVGTFLIKDINPGSTGSNPSQLTNVNGTLFFSATNGVSGVELWRSNGTTPGTVLVKDLNPGSADATPSQLTNVNGILFFVADDGVHGSELFETNGSGLGSGMLLVADINPGSAGSSPANLTNINGTLFFTANDGKHGREPWELSI
jgi:ELWxxDGT repeat protein